MTHRPAILCWGSQRLLLRYMLGGLLWTKRLQPCQGPSGPRLRRICVVVHESPQSILGSAENGILWRLGQERNRLHSRIWQLERTCVQPSSHCHLRVKPWLCGLEHFDISTKQPHAATQRSIVTEFINRTTGVDAVAHGLRLSPACLLLLLSVVRKKRCTYTHPVFLTWMDLVLDVGKPAKGIVQASAPLHVSAGSSQPDDSASKGAP